MSVLSPEFISILISMGLLMAGLIMVVRFSATKSKVIRRIASIPMLAGILIQFPIVIDPSHAFYLLFVAAYISIASGIVTYSYSTVKRIMREGETS